MDVTNSNYSLRIGGHLVQAVGMTTLVVAGRVVGVLGSYYIGPPRPSGRKQETTYVLQVHEELRNRIPAGSFLRLRWSGGYLDGGQIRNKRLLRPGEELILFLNRNHAHDSWGPLGSPLDWVPCEYGRCLVVRQGETWMLEEEEVHRPEEHPHYGDGERLFGKPVQHVLSRLREAIRSWDRDGGFIQGDRLPPEGSGSRTGPPH